MVKEFFEPIQKGSIYLVSNLGRIINSNTDRVLVLSKNKGGHLKFGARNEEGYFQTYSVAKLVADKFCDSDLPSHFNTVIHKDGDLENCCAENLEWRPRYYAIQYHRQFKGENTEPTGLPVREVRSEIEFENTVKAAIYFGLLISDVRQSANGNKFLHSFNRLFEWIK